MTQTTPHDSPVTLVFDAKDLREIRPGSPPTWAPNAGGVVKIGDFWQITGYISKTVQDRRMVSIGRIGSRMHSIEWWSTVTRQLHNFDLFRTCTSCCCYCTSSFCIVACQLARFQLTRRIARSLGDSWASCWYKVRLTISLKTGHMQVRYFIWYSFWQKSSVT